MNVKKKLYWCQGCWMDRNNFVKARVKMLRDNIESCKSKIDYYNREIEQKKQWIEDFEKEIEELQGGNVK